MQHKKSTTTHNTGFTLIETLVAIAILVVSIAGPMVIATKGLTTAIFARDQIVAFYLAQEAVEQIRNQRDENFLVGLPWLNGLSDCLGGKTCVIDVPKKTITECPGGACPPIKYDEVSGFYNYTDGEDSIYTRSVQLISVNDHEMAIDVRMEWDTGQFSRSFNIRENILNWQSLALPACNDGVDNDGDTFTDFPSDPGCSDANDNSEFDTPVSSIVYDSASEAVAQTVAQLTFSHTTGSAGDRILVVSAMAEHSTTACEATSVTYSGIALTQAASRITGSGFAACTELWYLINPPSGTHSVVINYEGTVNDALGGAITISNAKQASPEATASNGISSDTPSISTNITTLSDNSWVIDAAIAGDPGSFSPGASQLERIEISSGSASIAGGTREVGTPGTVSLSWGHAQPTFRMAHVLAAFAPK